MSVAPKDVLKKSQVLGYTTILFQDLRLSGTGTKNLTWWAH